MPKVGKDGRRTQNLRSRLFFPGLTHVVCLNGRAGSEPGQPYKGWCTEARRHSQSWAETGHSFEPGTVNTLK